MSFIGLIGRSSHGSGETLVLISVSPHKELVSLTGVVTVVVLSLFVSSSSLATGFVVASLLCVASVCLFIGGGTLLLSLELPWAVVVLTCEASAGFSIAAGALLVPLAPCNVSISFLCMVSSLFCITVVVFLSVPSVSSVFLVLSVLSVPSVLSWLLGWLSNPRR